MPDRQVTERAPNHLVIPANAGIQCRCIAKTLGPRLHGDDIETRGNACAS